MIREIVDALVQKAPCYYQYYIKEIIMGTVSSRISYELRYVCIYSICRRNWYIAAHIWKIYDFKIEVVPFIMNFSTDLTTVVKCEV
jgi:hypothetical protein